jgi:MPBQ/MSBQ methyltransferase
MDVAGDVAGRLGAHYRHGRLEAAVLEALAAAGKDVERLAPGDAMGADEFHTGGPAATRDVMAQLPLGPGVHVLDIGSGLGGPARHMAVATGCRVTGIDLTAEYVDVANSLSRRMGLAERVVFRCEAAEGMAVPEAGFDVATMLHVGMNIADKAGVFAAVRRALKPGGVFAVYDLMLVGEGEIAFPMPWSSVAESSFVEGPGAYRAALAGAGFDLVAERARVDFALESFELGRRRATETGRAVLSGLAVAMGAGAREKSANLEAMIRAGVLAPVEMFARA